MRDIAAEIVSEMLDDRLSAPASPSRNSKRREVAVQSVFRLALRMYTIVRKYRDAFQGWTRRIDDRLKREIDEEK